MSLRGVTLSDSEGERRSNLRHRVGDCFVGYRLLAMTG